MLNRRPAGLPFEAYGFLCRKKVSNPPLPTIFTVYLLDSANKKGNVVLATLPLVGSGGFEPSKAEPTDLQSAPFDHSGNSPRTATWYKKNDFMARVFRKNVKNMKDFIDYI